MDFYRNIMFAIPLDGDDLEYCWYNDDGGKGMNIHKGVLKATRFSQQRIFYFFSEVK